MTMTTVSMKEHVDEILKKLIFSKCEKTSDGSTKFTLNFYGYEYSLEIPKDEEITKEKANEAWGILSSRFFTDFERGICFTQAIESLEEKYAERESLFEDQKIQ